MQIISGTLEFEIKEPTAVVIGKFDGVHQGHQRLLAILQEQKKRNLKTVVFTFDRSLAGVIQKEADSYGEICTLEEKRSIFQKVGVDVLLEFPMNTETKKIPAGKFVTEILQKRLHCALLIAGEDITFGYQGLGNRETLLAYQHVCGYETLFVEKCKTDEILPDVRPIETVSSTLIRKQIAEGKIEQANVCMGRAFCITGEVVHGRGLAGSGLFMPTANVEWPEGKVMPAFGVYFTKIWLEGQTYYGVTNVGRKPTVEKKEQAPVLAETYLYDFSGDLYGKQMTVAFYAFVRPEQTFASLEALKKQLHQDMEKGYIYWAKKQGKNVIFSE